MRAYVLCSLFALVTATFIPISASAQTDAECVAVYDTNGTRVGRTAAGAAVYATVLFANEGRVARIGVSMLSISADANLYFTGSNCTGTEYMVWETEIQPQAHHVGTDVWYPDTTAAAGPLSPGSVRQAESGSCSNSVGAISSAVPAFNFTLPTFTPPFRLEPEACYTPPPAVAALTPYGLGAMALVLAFGAYAMVWRGAQ